MKLIILHPTVKPFALQTVMGYRGFSQSKLCKEVIGLSQPNLSRFLKGYVNSLSIEKIKEIIIYLDWPFYFLYKDIKPVKSSINL